MKIHRAAAALFGVGASVIQGVAGGTPRLRRLESETSEDGPAAQERIDQCLESDEPAAFVDDANDIDDLLNLAGDLVIPLYNGAFDNPRNQLITDPVLLALNGLPQPGLEFNGECLVPEGLPPVPQLCANYERFQWFSNTLPPSFDASRECSAVAPVLPFGPTFPLPVCPLPPDGYPGAGFPSGYDNTQMFPGFIHLTPFTQSPAASTWGYQKFGSIPLCLTPFLDITLENFKSDSDLTSVFAQNLEDRGEDASGNGNLRKRQYMSALSCDKLPFYEDLLDSKIRQLLDKVAASPGLPLLETWFEIVEEFFLDVHFGEVEHPEYVKRYFTRAFKTIAGLSVGCPDDAELEAAFCEAKEVKKYVQRRFEEITDPSNPDKSTIIYWWNEGGLPAESIVQEAIHNSLAFNQFLSSPFLVIAAKLFGRVKIDNLQQLADIPAIPLVPADPDFFDEYAKASSDQERLDINREVWRLLLPNNLWSSTLQTYTGQNDDALVTNGGFDFNPTAHIPFFIQAFNDGFNPSTGDVSAYNYNTGLYDPDFQPATGAAGCPFLRGDDDTESSSTDEYLGPEDMFDSTEDGETVIPAGHEGIIPVFDLPKYCPFGLGYRRCPAEAFNYMFMDKILTQFSKLEFEFQADPQIPGDTIGVLELLGGVPCSDEGAVPGGIVCRRNNILATLKA